MSLLQLFMSGYILYTINNCGNDTVLFGVNLIFGDGSICIGGFTFLATPFKYHLFFIWISQYTLLTIAVESRPLFYLIPPGGIAYVSSISLWCIFPLPRPPRPPWPPLPQPPMPSNWRHMPHIPPLRAELIFRLRPYLPDYSWVAGKSRDITVDKYLEVVLKLTLWLDMQILTSFLKSLFGQLIFSKSFLTFSSSYRVTL